MKVLFIGGTGIISSAVPRLAVERGIESYTLILRKDLIFMKSMLVRTSNILYHCNQFRFDEKNQIQRNSQLPEGSNPTGKLQSR